MEKSANEIDQIIRNKVLDYEEAPSPGLWRRLSRRLSPNDSFRWTLLIVALLSVLAFWMMNSESKSSEAMLTTESRNVEMNGVPVQSVKLEQVDEKQVIETNVVRQIPINDSESTPVIYESGSLPEQRVQEDRVASIIFVEENFRNQLTFSKLENKGTRQVSIHSIPALDAPQPFINKIDEGKMSLSENANIINNKRWRLSLSMEVGYAHSWRLLSADPQFEDFKNDRIKNETPISQLSYDFKVNYQFKNWVLSVGLGYATYGEKLNYHLSETVVDPDGGYYDVDSILMPNYNADNNWDPILVGYNITWVDEYKQINYGVDNTNLYHYLEIPISVGYRFNYNKLSVCPSVGMSFGFLYRASVQLLVSNSGGFEKFSKTSDYLQSKVNNVNFGLSLEYLVTPNYGLYIKPFYKQGLNSIYTNYPLSSSFRNAGIKLGINIYL